MAAKKNLAPTAPYRSDEMWAVSNCGVVRSVHRTKSKAIKNVEYETMEPWRKAKKYMEVWPCRVVRR